MQVPFNDLYLQNEPLEKEITSAITSIIKSSSFVGGKDIAEFENNFSKYLGGGSCAGTGNGTDSLLLALMACGIGEGDEVIVPAQSFIATIEVIFFLKAKPIIVDIDADRYTIDTAKIEAVITAKTKAIVPVHLYGQPAQMDEIISIAQKHNLHVIEDAAQSIGAKYNGKSTGLIGTIGTYSFFPGKNLGAFGDAGCVVSNDSKLIDKVKELRNHGRSITDRNSHNSLGLNCRMDTLQAAVINIKLKHIEKWTKRRQKIAKIYNDELSGIVKTPVYDATSLSSFHLYVIQHENRDDLKEALAKSGIESAVHYPVPMHMHKAVSDILGNQKGKFPVAEKAADKILSLPIFPEMNDSMVEAVVHSVKEHS